MLYYAKKDSITLAEEIDFIEKYIRLMQLKHDEKVKIDYRFSELQDKSYSIAPLLFVPLVENAFKHGVSTQDVSDIFFEFYLSDNKLIFKSENSNHPKTSTDKSGSGIGLENLTKRLELIYPSKHTFHFGVLDGKFIAELQIKLENYG
jgi:LytS/YehU family sensor histidine kinase